MVANIKEDHYPCTLSYLGCNCQYHESQKNNPQSKKSE